MKVLALVKKILEACCWGNPNNDEIIVSLYERDGEGNVIDISNYPINHIAGADGNNRICIEKDQEIGKR